MLVYSQNLRVLTQYSFSWFCKHKNKFSLVFFFLMLIEIIHFILGSWRNTKHCRLIVSYYFLLNLQCFTNLKIPLFDESTKKPKKDGRKDSCRKSNYFVVRVELFNKEN